MRANPKLSAGCLGVFVLDRFHWFDCERAGEGLGSVKIMTGTERRDHLWTGCADWSKGDTE